MSLKGVLAGSASVLAILTAATPSFAQSTDNSNQPETVVVTGLRYSEEQSLDLKKNADTMVDAIVASDIGKLPDKNVADALQRLPASRRSRSLRVKAVSTKTIALPFAAPTRA